MAPSKLSTDFKSWLHSSNVAQSQIDTILIETMPFLDKNDINGALNSAALTLSTIDQLMKWTDEMNKAKILHLIMGDVLDKMQPHYFVDYNACKQHLEQHNIMQKTCNAVFHSLGLKPPVDQIQNPKPLEENALEILQYIETAQPGSFLSGQLLMDIPDIHGIVLRKTLFVRACFKDLFDFILTNSEFRPIAVVGDPGIGKSAAAVYIFLRLVELRTEIVVLVSQGGLALIYKDGQMQFEEKLPADVLKNPKTWLLLDGHADEKPYADKKTRGIVFSSPKRQNYHEFVKNSGILFFMPPWDWVEVETFIDLLASVKKEPSPWKVNDLKSVVVKESIQPNNQDQPDEFASSSSSKGERATPDVPSPDPCHAAPSSSNDRSLDIQNAASSSEAYDKEGKTTETQPWAPLLDVGVNEDTRVFLDEWEKNLDDKELVKARFALVGGRIRYLATDTMSLWSLKLMVHRAMCQLSIETLRSVDVVDIGGFVPSICYCIFPIEFVREKKRYMDYNHYCVGFPTVYIRQLAKQFLVKQILTQKVSAFGILQGISSAASLCGTLFEDLCIDILLSEKSLTDLPIRVLSFSQNSSESTTGTLSIHKVAVDDGNDFGLSLVDKAENVLELRMIIPERYVPDLQDVTQLKCVDANYSLPLSKTAVNYIDKAAKGFFTVPKVSNFPVCVAIAKGVFFQITVSTTHPCYFKYGEALSAEMKKRMMPVAQNAIPPNMDQQTKSAQQETKSSLKRKAQNDVSSTSVKKSKAKVQEDLEAHTSSSVYMIYIVPDTLIDAFKFQKPKLKDGSIASDSITKTFASKLQQIVVGIPPSAFSVL